MGLIEKYGSMFVNGMGGINAEGIRLALDVEDISQEKRSEIIQKIITYMTTAMNVNHQAIIKEAEKNKEQNNGKTNQDRSTSRSQR